MTAHELWQHVTSTLMVGTERRPWSIGDGAATPLGRMLAHPREDAADRAALDALGAVALHRRAGWTPPAGVWNRLTPDPVTPAPPCSDAAVALLAEACAERDHQAVREWLRLAAAAGVRPPDMMLIDLLNLGANDADMRLDVAEHLGSRGAWLAALQPEWEYAIPLGDEIDITSRWQTAAPKARLTILKRLRHRDPERGRTLMASTWSSESAADREAFLRVLATKLSMDDEPFLEAALGDRSKGVRAAAVELLATLPDSRLCDRMYRRALAALTATADQRGFAALSADTNLRVPAPQITLAISLPGEPDTAALRDGVPSVSSPTGATPKGRAARQQQGTADADLTAASDTTSQLAAMLACVAPSRLAAALGGTLAALHDAIELGPGAGRLLAALTTGAERHGDTAWASLLWRRWLVEADAAISGPRFSFVNAPPPLAHTARPNEPAAATWVNLVPEAEFEEPVLEWLNLAHQPGLNMMGMQCLLLALTARSCPWSERLADEAVQASWQALLTGDWAEISGWLGLWDVATMRLPVDCCEVLFDYTKISAERTNAISGLDYRRPSRRMRRRADMHTELTT